MTGYQRGEIVDITIKGVRIADEHKGLVAIIADHPDGRPATYPMPPQAAVTRVAPANWPPRTGDLWRNGDGMLYLALQADAIPSEDGLPLSDVAGDWTYANVLLADGRGLTLVYREDDQDGASSDG